jgi:GPH family glycoside/pentoside/hexuronide:cation symporter
MDYGEWKYKKRSEGMITCAQSMMAKIGTAAGIGIAGILMGLSGYDGAAEVQSASANNMIILLNTVVPSALAILMLIIFSFYDLDKKLPQIRAEIGNGKIGNELK